MTDDSDLGIVLYLKGPSSADAASYYDRKGTSRTAGTLGMAYTAMGTDIDTAHPYVSAAGSASMFVVITGIGGGETITVRCRQSYKPDPNPGPTPDAHFAGVYIDTFWVLNANGSTPEVATALTANGAYLLQTPNTLLGDQLEFSAKSSSGASTASVMIAAKVSR